MRVTPGDDRLPGTAADTDADATPVALIRPIDGPGDARAGRRRDRRPEARRRRPYVRALRAALLLVAAVLGYYLVSIYQVWSAGRSDQTRPVDAIVVLGAAQYDGRPSPQLAARLDHVAELWPRDLAPLVVVTGGKQPADRYTEAEASMAYLVERGVPAGSIVQENVGRSTEQSLHGVADLLRERGLDSVLIVTDPYHSLRSRLIAQEAGLTAYVSPTPTSIVTGGSSLVRHLEEAAGVAIGRLVGFDRI